MCAISKYSNVNNSNLHVPFYGIFKFNPSLFQEKNIGENN